MDTIYIMNAADLREFFDSRKSYKNNTISPWNIPGEQKEYISSSLL